MTRRVDSAIEEEQEQEHLPDPIHSTPPLTVGNATKGGYSSRNHSIPLIPMSVANKPILDGLLIFEQPFARVPYENYRKVFRTAQKNIERELGAIQTTSNDISKNARSSSRDPEEAIKSLEGMIDRVEGLKRKVYNP
jgi:hypothetical protein